MSEYINMMTIKYRNNCFTFENRWSWFFAPFETFGHCVDCDLDLIVDHFLNKLSWADRRSKKSYRAILWVIKHFSSQIISWIRISKKICNVCYDLQMRPLFCFIVFWQRNRRYENQNKMKTSADVSFDHVSTTAHHPHPHLCYLAVNSEAVAYIQKWIRYSNSVWKLGEKM